MNRGIWATWYDLADGGDREFIDWLHGEYLPGLTGRRDTGWAAHYAVKGGGTGMRELQKKVISYTDDDSVGDGTQYVMLAGAPSPHAFFQPDAAWRPENQDAETKAMLDRRSGVRSCVFAVEEGVEGPDIAKRLADGTPGPAIQMGNFRIKNFEDELLLGSWYAQYRLPFMAQMEGCIRTRKLVSAAGWAKHSILYEFTSLDARLKNFEEPHEALAADETEWTGKIVRTTLHAAGSPSIAERVWPTVGDAEQ